MIAVEDDGSCKILDKRFPGSESPASDINSTS
jgi:hypothetical protein